jgi:hypothetical protein
LATRGLSTIPIAHVADADGTADLEAHFDLAAENLGHTPEVRDALLP